MSKVLSAGVDQHPLNRPRVTDSFDAIPAAQRDKVLAVCHAKFHELQLKARKQDADALVEIQKSGVQRVAVSPEEVKSFTAIELASQKNRWPISRRRRRCPGRAEARSYS